MVMKKINKFSSKMPQSIGDLQEEILKLYRQKGQKED